MSETIHQQLKHLQRLSAKELRHALRRSVRRRGPHVEPHLAGATARLAPAIAGRGWPFRTRQEAGRRVGQRCRPAFDAAGSTSAEVATVAVERLADQDDRLPPPGTILTRSYKGTTIRVQVLEKGFAYEGELYKSLSAVAKAVTGSHCNGFLFFQLNTKNGKA